MQEKTILTVSLLATFLGLALLFWYADNLDTSAIARLNAELPPEKVFLQGVVKSITRNDKVLFLKLEGERVEVTEVVFFPDQNILLKEGDYVEVSGSWEEYQGRKEVVAQKVVVK